MLSTGVSFNINPGETVGLVGESGSGKTTLAKLLLGLTPMTSGSILIDGVEVTPHNRREYQGKMGAVFQDPASSLNLVGRFDKYCVAPWW